VALVGRLVVIGGPQAIADREVAVFGMPISPDGGHDVTGGDRLLGRTTTDADGGFELPSPPGRYLRAFALLDDGAGRRDIDLLDDGSFPDEVAIVLSGQPSHLRFGVGP
jgi:hypothetical protein